MHGLEADMKTQARQVGPVLQVLLYLGLALLTAAPVLAQVPVDENGNPVAPLQGTDDTAAPLLSGAELEELVGPVALYPDDLLAIVLPASTYPLQIVEAARFLQRLESDPSLKPDDEWDDSVAALLNYPEAVKLMNDDIDWTWRLGEAVVAQQADVIAAIEAFRDRAYAAGNLKSDEHQNVSNDDGVIEIEPVDEEVIYVPYYEPERVVVYQPQPVYYYYPHAYPLYYYPYPAGYAFTSGFFWGVTTAYTIGWWTDNLFVYHHSYWGHPYYGRSYYSYYYYRRPSLSVYNRYYVYNSNHYSNNRYRDGDYWRPSRHGGARPGDDGHRVHYYRDRSRDDWGDRDNGHRSDPRVDHHRDRGGDTGTGTHDRAGNRDRQAGNRNDGGSRERDRANPGARQADSRDDGGARRHAGGNPAGRAERDGGAVADRSAIRFRPRSASNTGTPAATINRRARASEDLHRGAEFRTGFAPNQPASRAASSNGRRVAPTSSAGRQRTPAAVNNPRYPASATPRLSSARPTPALRPSSSPAQRVPSRSEPRASVRQPSAAAPSPPQRSAASNSRSESRSSGSASRSSGRHGDSRSKRH